MALPTCTSLSLAGAQCHSTSTVTTSTVQLPYSPNYEWQYGLSVERQIVAQYKSELESTYMKGNGYTAPVLTYRQVTQKLITELNLLLESE